MNKRTLKLLTAVTLLAIAGLILTGCTIKRELTTINTPAVYNVSKDASGVLQSNLVSAASVTKSIKRERVWLPEGYAVVHNSLVYGIDVSMTDSTTQTPKVRAGIFDDSWRWIPSSTNNLYAPPITASAAVDNKAVPFWMKAKGEFSSGNTSVIQSDTNSAATSLVPGTPANQQK